MEIYFELKKKVGREALKASLSFLLGIAKDEICYLEESTKDNEAQKAQLFFTCYDRESGDFKMSCSLSSTEKFRSGMLGSQDSVFDFLRLLSKSLNNQIFIDVTDKRGRIFNLDGEEKEVGFLMEGDCISIIE